MTLYRNWNILIIPHRWILLVWYVAVISELYAIAKLCGQHSTHSFSWCFGNLELETNKFKTGTLYTCMWPASFVKYVQWLLLFSQKSDELSPFIYFVGDKSVSPLPVGFWPLDKTYRHRELTGRSSDIILGDNVTFTEDSPLSSTQGKEHYCWSPDCSTAWLKYVSMN